MARYGLIHGDARVGKISPEFVAWSNMKTRCFNPNCAMAKHYSERQISMTPEWNNFQTFLRDMGRKPVWAHSLGRINNDQGYSKENCRWETSTQQNRNRRTVKLSLAKARKIRILHRSFGFPVRRLGREFGVTHESIRKVISYQDWRENGAV